MAKKYVEKQALGQQSAPETRDVLSQIAHHLQEIGYSKALRALQKECKEHDIEVDAAQWSSVASRRDQHPTTLKEFWTTISSNPGGCPSLSEPAKPVEDDSDSDSDDEEEQAAEVDNSSEDSSDDTSDEDSEEESASAGKAGQKRKRELTPDSSSDSSSESSDSEVDTKMEDASDSSDSDSDSDNNSSSSESDHRPVKRAKVSSKSDGSSDSDSSSSDSDSESEQESDSSSDSDSDSDSSSSSSDDSSSDSDSSGSASPPPKKTKKTKKSDKFITQPTIIPKLPTKTDASSATSSATLRDSPVLADKAKNEDTLVVNDAEGKKEISATKENVKKLKKEQIPFSRIPADQKVDPRFASNAYVPYDYAERAHRDLIVTKGKGFTKEKNKKKRGSYRGGAIDFTPKGIKFDD